MAENTKAANNAAASDVDIGIITELLQKHKDLDIAITTPELDEEKQNYKKVVNWKTKPKLNGAAALNGKQLIIRNTDQYAEIDWDIFKHLTPAQVQFIKNKFPQTFEFGRDGKGHSLYKVKNIPKKPESTKRIELGEKGVLLEYRGKGSYSIFAGPLDKTSKATTTGKEIKEIDYKYLKKLFNRAVALAALAVIRGHKGDGINNFIMAAAGEFFQNKIPEKTTIKIFKSWLHLVDRTDRETETVKSIEGIYKSGHASNIFSKSFLVPISDPEKYQFRAIVKRVGLTYEEIIEDPTDELEVFEHTGKEKIKPRPWLIEGWALKKALTLLVGQPGIGKTMFLHMLGYALATGNPILLKTILERGNVLLLAAEETLNEMDLRLKAASEMMGKNDGKFKIYKRGLENELKLVKFTKDGAAQTTQYKQLLNTIKNKEIKYIIIDPLINFQTGSYDENSNQNMDNYVKNYLIPIAVKMDGAVFAGHHTNKISMVSTHDHELLVDNQNALTAARGASSLIGAARFVLALQPMTRKLWDDHFKVHVTDGSNFVHYTGLIEAKSNYNIIAADILWLKKNDVHVQTDDGYSEKTGCYSITDLNKITKAKNKLKAAQNLQWCKSQMPIIQKLMKNADADTITLNSIVLELLPQDPDHADEKIPEATIKTRIRRKLENGFSGQEETKDGLQRTGVEWSDGYNYWLKRDHSKSGAASVFITRAVDFKRKKR